MQLSITNDADEMNGKNKYNNIPWDKERERARERTQKYLIMCFEYVCATATSDVDRCQLFAMPYVLPNQNS